MFNQNWKTNIAFVVFVSLYVFSVTSNQEIEKLELTGYLALLATFAMMIRSKNLTTILTNISEGFKR